MGDVEGFRRFGVIADCWDGRIQAASIQGRRMENAERLEDPPGMVLSFRVDATPLHAGPWQVLCTWHASASCFAPAPRQTSLGRVVAPLYDMATVAFVLDRRRRRRVLPSLLLYHGATLATP